jgi:Zn-dependent peptidase ImmA (M78 family)/transcriptional regulator with XRE-family HTH domain
MDNVFALRLKELREKYNFSLQELGDKIGVAKQSVHKFENGQVNPSSDTVLKLSELFNVPYSFFYENPEAFAFDFKNIKFRDGHKIPNREGLEMEVKQEVLGYISRFMQLESLLQIERVFENPLADLKIEDEKDIEKAAKVLRKKWKLGNDPIADVVTTLEGKGIFVVEIKHVEDFAGLSGTINNDIPLIILNENSLTPERKRFTTLHELGHIVLEFAREFTNEKVEFFCNYFAGAVLIVDEALFSELGKNRSLISLAELRRIKEMYGISIQAIIVRTRTTGFINYSTYQEWSKSYEEWRTADDKANDFGHFNCCEKATRFNNLLVQGVNEKRISWSKAAELSGMKIDILKKELGILNFSINN